MLKILFVYSGNSEQISPFIEDQAKALRQLEIDIFYYPIIGKGITGYLRNVFLLRKHLKKNTYDLIHAHYGLSGLVANLQGKLPVVTTFHGSDINNPKNLPIAKLVTFISDHSIFVSSDLMEKSKYKTKCEVIPCGVNLDLFKNNPTYNSAENEIKILFSSSFNRPEKNYPLALQAVKKLQDKLNRNVNLIELEDYTREEVANLINKVDAGLLTSLTEGSSQFIKEVMACNCPCVATNVGDINWLFGNMEGYYLCDHNVEEIANILAEAINFRKKKGETNGRKRITDLELDSQSIASRIKGVYHKVLEQ